MLYRFLVVVAATLPFYTPSFAAESVGEAQSIAMQTCSNEAGQMKGDARKAFVFKCLRSRLFTGDSNQDGSVQELCASPVTGPQVIACSAAKFKEADVSLNRVYRELRARLKKVGENGFDESLVNAQRDWVRFRQTHCNFDGTYEGAGGSFVSAKIGECMAVETKTRTEYLSGVLKYLQ